MCGGEEGGGFYLSQFRLRPTSFFYSSQFYSGQVLLWPILLRPSSTKANLFLGPERGGGPKGGRPRREGERGPGRDFLGKCVALGRRPRMSGFLGCNMLWM